MSAKVTAFLHKQQVDLAICLGIAGAYPETFSVGEVVYVATERWGDLGIEEKDGSFKDVFEAGLISYDEIPYQHGRFVNPDKDLVTFLPQANGLTVNKVSGNLNSIQRIREKWAVEIESMEGAGFFYACLMAKTPFMEIRSISNIVESRDSNTWEIPQAIANAGKVMIEMLSTM
jgi:futalosine hydrolase